MISNKEVDRKERIFIYYEVSFSCKSSHFATLYFSSSDKRYEFESIDERDLKN